MADDQDCRPARSRPNGIARQPDYQPSRFDKWNATTSQVDTVLYVINGANQITTACTDANTNGVCDTGETQATYQYDAYGNLLNDGTTQYTYDAANRVASITAASVTTTYTSYGYSGDGDRISQTVVENGVTTTTTYVLDIATPLTMVLSETTGGVTTQYWHGLDTLAQSDGSTTEYFAYDGLGSVRQLVDASGSVGLAQTFDPYGNGYAKAGSAQSTLGYTGEQTDSNGFVFLRARYYQPGMGRFTQMDPSRMERNAYQYGMSNPVMLVDPSGLCGSKSDSTQDQAKCEQLVQNLEAAYGMIIYWPSRRLPDSVKDIIEGLGCFCDEKALPSAACNNGNPLVQSSDGVRSGYNSKYKEWRYKEVFSMFLAITMYELELGRNAVNAFLSGVAFVRMDAAPRLLVPGKFILGQNYPASEPLDTLPGFGGRYAIAITNVGTGEGVQNLDTGAWHYETNSQMTWTFVHEIAHRVDLFAENNKLYDTQANWQDKGVNIKKGPTLYARTGTREDIAESITWYLWQARSQDFIISKQKPYFLFWRRTVYVPLLAENPNGAGTLTTDRTPIVEALFDTYRTAYSPFQPGQQVWDYTDVPGGW